MKYKKVNIFPVQIYGLINWSHWDLPHENADTNLWIPQTLNSEFSKRNSTKTNNPWEAASKCEPSRAHEKSTLTYPTT